MNITEIPVEGYEKVVHATDPASGLNAFIAVHDTTLGPALGGIRLQPYDSHEACMTDAVRLAKGMTYKAAIAETGQGGGKGVINHDPSEKTDELFLAMGEFVESLGGLYIAAEDMNMTVANLETIAQKTKWVSGLAVDQGSSGNPSPMTALGCLIGLKATAKELFGDESLQDRTIAIQGIGAVGGALAKHCIEVGATVSICDIDQEKVIAFASETGAIPLEGPDAALTYPCDFLSPCARGGLLNADSIASLQCKAIGGAANNQLLSDEDGQRLSDRGILYAPDYVINAGGIINLAGEFQPGGYSESVARDRCQSIARALEEIFQIAKDESISTAQAADHLAEKRISDGADSSC